MGTWRATFRKRWNERAAVAIDLAGKTREFSVTVLFGKSGEGKTTALRCLAGLERPDDGEIVFEEDCWFSSTIHKPPQQRRVGLLLQERALFPHLTVAGNVAFGIRSGSRYERERRTRELMRQWGIEDLENQFPRELSGGEQQRTALARSLAAEPRLLLLDEPLSSLDEPTRTRLGKELRKQLEAYDIPVLLVTHRRDEALTLGDRICVMHGGKLVQSGEIQDVFDQPLDADVARILGWSVFQTASIVESRGNLVSIRVGERTITVTGNRSRGEGSPGNSTRWGIRSHDVFVLKPGEPVPDNFNVIPGRVIGIRPDERGIRAEVDFAERIEIVVPRDPASPLIAPGNEVRLAFLQTAARLF